MFTIGKLLCIFVFSTIFAKNISGEDVKLPPNVPLCEAGPKNCLDKTFTTILKTLKDIPVIKAPELDPYVTTRLNVFRTRNQNAPISINIRNLNTTVTGMKNLEIIEATGWEKDPHNSKFEIKIRVPLIRSIAAYKANLKFFNLPIIGQGINNTTLKGVEVTQDIMANVVSRNGDDYLDIQKINTDIKLKKLIVHIQDELNDGIIMNTINQVMNDNWREIFAEMKPDFERTIGETIKDFVQPILEAIPYKNFFAE